MKKRELGDYIQDIHEYFGIDLEIVWEVVITELPPIKPLIQKVLEGEET